MKRLFVILATGLVCVAAVAVLSQTGLGQAGPNPTCPYLRTDEFGFPLNPPYSEYGTPTSQPTIVDGEFFDIDAPCCGTVVRATSNGITTITATLSSAPAIFDPNSGQSFCQPPTFDLTEGPDPADSTFLTTIINPFFGRQGCPQDVDFALTVDVNGAVRNCTPPPATLPDRGGGSNFLLTGTNAN
jgi:hypothetical protein